MMYEIPQDSVKWIKKELSKKYSLEAAEEKYREILKTYEKFSKMTLFLVKSCNTYLILSLKNDIFIAIYLYTSVRST